MNSVRSFHVIKQKQNKKNIAHDHQRHVIYFVFVFLPSFYFYLQMCISNKLFFLKIVLYLYFILWKMLFFVQLLSLCPKNHFHRSTILCKCYLSIFECSGPISNAKGARDWYFCPVATEPFPFFLFLSLKDRIVRLSAPIFNRRNQKCLY